MKRDNVIRMAREAGCDIAWADSLERFAALVAAAAKEEMLMAGNDQWLEEARKAEREACAKVCDAEVQSRQEAAHRNHGTGTPAYGRQMAGVNAATNCAAAIRARGQA